MSIEKDSKEQLIKNDRDAKWGGLDYSPTISPIKEELDTINNIKDMSNEHLGEDNDAISNISILPSDTINSLGYSLGVWKELYEEIKKPLEDYTVSISIDLNDIERNALKDTNGGNKTIDTGIITNEVYEEILKDPNKSKHLYRIKNTWDEKSSSKNGIIEAELIEPMYIVKRELVNCFKILDDAQIKNYSDKISIKDNDTNVLSEVKLLAKNINDNKYDQKDIVLYNSKINRLECISNICTSQKYFADYIALIMQNMLTSLKDRATFTPSIQTDSKLSSFLLDKSYEESLIEIKELREKTSMYFDKDIKAKNVENATNSITLYLDVLSELIESIKLEENYDSNDESIIKGMYKAVKEKDEAINELISSTRMTNIIVKELFHKLYQKDNIRRCIT